MKRAKIIAVLICIIASVAASASATPLLYDANYKIENYASYSSEGMGSIYGSGFDANGNLFVTYGGSNAGHTDGSIARITPTGVTVRWADNLHEPKRVLSTDGTAYGDNLYVTERLSDDIRKVESDGSDSFFASGSSPVALALDRYGNYGNKMFFGNTGPQGIYSVSTSGVSTKFGTFPGNATGGGPRDIEFSPTTKYGGKMFVGMRIYGGTYDYLNGIHALDTNGNAAPFAPSINLVLDMAFDTVGTQFNNELFAIGNKVGVPGNQLWRIDESGNATSLAFLKGGAAQTLAFGTDGAIYISMNNSAEQTDIWKISEIPEPASVLLLALGGMLAGRKRKLS